jgi:Fe-S cluster biogenesis protein NfuA
MRSIQKGRNIVEEKINAALEQIRPFLRQDGGDIEYVGITDDNIVQVRLKGHCAGCMGARMTIEGVVQQILQEQVPEVKGVQAVE